MIYGVKWHVYIWQIWKTHCSFDLCILFIVLHNVPYSEFTCFFVVFLSLTCVTKQQFLYSSNILSHDSTFFYLTFYMIFITFVNSTWLLGPVMYSDWLIFKNSSSMKLHVWWKCSLVWMFFVRPSKKCFFVVAPKSKMTTTARQSFNMLLWLRLFSGEKNSKKRFAEAGET